MKHCSRSLAVAALACLVSSVPGSASVLYNNGPINGTLSAWTINYGYSASDSFTLTSQSTLTGISFGEWLYPGDTALTVEWSIGTSPYSAADGSSTAALTDTQWCSGCAYGFYDIETSSFTLPSITLSAGTYWLTLQDVVTSQGDPAFWDINNGPSVAYESLYGPVNGNLFPGSNSNAFEVLGTTTDPVPEPDLKLIGSVLLGAVVLFRRKLVRK